MSHKYSRDWWKERLPFITAFANGEQVKYFNRLEYEFLSFEDNANEYSSPKYRPFKFGDKELNDLLDSHITNPYGVTCKVIGLGRGYIITDFVINTCKIVPYNELFEEYHQDGQKLGVYE